MYQIRICLTDQFSIYRGRFVSGNEGGGIVNNDLLNHPPFKKGGDSLVDTIGGGGGRFFSRYNRWGGGKRLLSRSVNKIRINERKKTEKKTKDLHVEKHVSNFKKFLAQFLIDTVITPN